MGTHKVRSSEGIENSRIERGKINNLVIRTNSECKERAVETNLKKFDKEKSDNESPMTENTERDFTKIQCDLI